MGTVLSSSTTPVPFQYCAALISSWQTPTIWNNQKKTVDPISFLTNCLDCCLQHTFTVSQLTWVNLTVPKGVEIGCNCASSVINMCCIRDSLASSGVCQGMWSPAHNVLSAWKHNKTWIILNLKSNVVLITPFESSLMRSSLQYPSQSLTWPSWRHSSQV